jgi:hypothetical protein
MSLYQLILTFFGLTLDYRLSLFTQIHEIIFHGNGGYDYDTVYNMPLWLRQFTFSRIKEFHEKQNSQDQDSNIEKSIQTMKRANIDKTITPPTYVTKAKASKK